MPRHQWGMAHPAVCNKSRYFPNVEIFLCHPEMDEPLRLHTEKSNTIMFLSQKKTTTKTNSVLRSCFSFSPLTYNCHWPFIKWSHYLPIQGKYCAERAEVQSALWGNISAWTPAAGSIGSQLNSCCSSLSTGSLSPGPLHRLEWWLRRQRGHRSWGSTEGHFPQDLNVTYARACLLSPRQWVTQTQLNLFLTQMLHLACLSFMEQSNTVDVSIEEPGLILQNFNCGSLKPYNASSVTHWGNFLFLILLIYSWFISCVDFCCIANWFSLRIFFYIYSFPWDFSVSSDGKESACKAGDPGSIPGLRRSPGEGKGNPCQYFCLENPMEREEPGRLQSMGSQRVRQDWAT